MDNKSKLLCDHHIIIDDNVKWTKQLNKINTKAVWKVFGLTHPIKLRYADIWEYILGTNI
jgi:hypothetical protein